MKNKKLNYEVKIRDFEATKSKHLGAIQRLKKAIKENEPVMPFNYMAENVECDIKNSPFYAYNIISKDGWVARLKPQARLKIIKGLINVSTRKEIVQFLEWNEMPKSWDTAFYCLYYKKINSIMISVAKLFVKELK